MSDLDDLFLPMLDADFWRVNLRTGILRFPQNREMSVWFDEYFYFLIHQKMVVWSLSDYLFPNAFLALLSSSAILSRSA